MKGAIDLRSDTVTQPTEAMRQAMACAEVGDDVYGEDPTVNRLQETAAALLGMEAAVFVPSGTMGNLLAIKCHTQPGDEVVLHHDAHIVLFEMSGVSWFSGAMPRTVGGARGLMDPEETLSRIQHRPPYYRARTACVAVENSHNAGGGSVYPMPHLRALRDIARERDIPVHLDGARLFNAAAALGVSAREIAECADSVTFCLSKGLSAPVGSLLCGTQAFVEEAKRVRRVLGGGMRQAGVIAAAGLVALETMRERLAEDHLHAQRLATALQGLPGVRINPDEVQTNIVVFRLEGGAPACRRLVARLREQGVLVSQLADDNVRMVTHRHIGPAEVDRALQAVEETLAT